MLTQIKNCVIKLLFEYALSTIMSSIKVWVYFYFAMVI